MKNLTEIAAELEEARNRYEACRRVASDARRGETNALNTLTQAQKALDAKIATMRNDLPVGEWAPRGESV